MVKCCIIGCNSDSRRNEGLSFFRFPKNECLRKLWMDRIDSQNIKPAGVIKLCSKHFEENCLNRTLSVVQLKDNVIPTLFPFSSSFAQLRTPLSIRNYNTMSKTDLTQAVPKHRQRNYESSSANKGRLAVFNKRFKGYASANSKRLLAFRHVTFIL